MGRSTNTFSAQPWMQLPLDCKKWRGGGGQKRKGLRTAETGGGREREAMASLTNRKERETEREREKKKQGCDAIVCLVVTNVM